MQVRALVWLAFILLLSVVACGDRTAATPVPTVTPTPQPTATVAVIPPPTSTGGTTPAPTAGPIPTSTVGVGPSSTPTAVPVPTPAPNPSPTFVAPATKAPEPRAAEGAGDGVRRIVESATLLRLWDEPPTLDPHLSSDATSATIIVEVFGGLVTINPELEIVPDLALDWELADGGRSYRFSLVEDAKFHNGRAVTAQDIKWSLERAAAPITRAPVVSTYLGDIVGVKEKLEGLATEIAGVEVIDDYTLQITIDAPKAYFLAKLIHPNAFVLDRNNVEGNPAWVTRPNGTGPFKLNEYIPREVLILKRNENYHLGPPKLEEVRFILSGGNPLLMYANDEIHIIELGLGGPEPLLDPSHPLSKELHRSPPSFSVGYMGMNAGTPPFDDVKVRQALNFAIDREGISRTLFQDTLPTANGILPPGFPGYSPDIRGFEYQPEKAQRLLAESRYGGDLEAFPTITLTVPGSFGSQVSASTEAILDSWRRVLGIEVEVQLTEWATYLQDLGKQRLQMFGGLSWIADYPDPENFLDVLFHSDSSNNYSGYSNLEVDRLLEQARVIQDQEDRHQLYHRLESVILEDAPWVLLWHGGIEYVLVKSYVKDYFLTPMVVPVLRYVYMTEE